MKINFKFIIFIILLLIIVFGISTMMPHKFSWKQSFSRYDKEPFGCYVFDDVLSSSLRNGYMVTDASFHQLENDSTTGLKSILSVSDYQSFYDREREILFRMVNKGYKVMLVASSFNYALMDTLGIEDYNSYFNFQAIKRYLSKQKRSRDSIQVVNPKQGKKYYEFYPQFCNGYFTKKIESEQLSDSFGITKDSIIFSTEIITLTDDQKIEKDTTSIFDIRALAVDKDGDPTAVKVLIGKGELYLVSNPLLFTNYGMLDKDNAGYIFNILSYIDDLPVVRTESYNETDSYFMERTPLEFVLTHPPLKWALYILLISIILFMIFTAKRRQRIIPIVKPPVNRTVEFTELIGTLYFQRKDYADLMHKKYIYFAEQLKRNTYIDIESEELSTDLCKRLSEKTGMDADKLFRLLTELNKSLENNEITEIQMKDLINRMNEVLINSR